jgi:hypothetical protein
MEQYQTPLGKNWKNKGNFNYNSKNKGPNELHRAEIALVNSGVSGRIGFVHQIIEHFENIFSIRV